MRPDTAPGSNNFPLELLNLGKPEIKNCLMLFILNIWETNTFTSEFRDAKIITILKKEDRENCNSYRGRESVPSKLGFTTIPYQWRSEPKLYFSTNMFLPLHNCNAK